VADDVARATLYLKLLGCDNGSWNHSGGLEEFNKETLMPQVKKEHLVEALAKAADDAALAPAGGGTCGASGDSFSGTSACTMSKDQVDRPS
jgi:hypothetical protein